MSTKTACIKILAKLFQGKTLNWRENFNIWESNGFHIVPNHFYQPIPDSKELKDELWSRESSLAGINMNIEKQLELLNTFGEQYKKEYDLMPLERTGHNEYFVNNGAFESVDGEALYCIVRNFKPKNVIEIGSGFSTLVTRSALRMCKDLDPQFDCNFVAIEPYPNQFLVNGFPELKQLIVKKVQDVDLSFFQCLGENDILFIDSSHMLKIGSDVQYEILEIIPNLKKGVLIHIHDIFLPREYHKSWIKEQKWFWNEQYLLQAFLAFNESFEIVWAGSYLHLKFPDRLEQAFRSYQRNARWPGSLWMRKTK